MFTVDSANLGAGSSRGTGGMETKLRAAEKASAAGVFTVIASSSNPVVVSEILAYYSDQRLENLALEAASSRSTKGFSSDSEESMRPLHTIFVPEANPLGSPSFVTDGALTLPSPP